MLARMVGHLVDPRRIRPATVLEERAMLEGWLEFHRMTLLLKCEDVDDARRKARPIPTSLLSLHGLVRHMAEVERSWFRRTLLDEPELPRIWRRPDDDDSDFDVNAAVWADDVAAWHAECEASRRAAAGLALDHTGHRRGERVSLRWIYTHMIEEYARHNGHADIIRELVDGAVGD
jgi:uncharacterized damage-inducible protein DinB